MKQQIADFRNYRPAVVILFDFVKHSARSPAEVHVIQMITEDILADSVKSLSLTQYIFTHTGDGWMCILLGNDSARAMDFVNLSFTALRQRLEPYKQAFRAGMDYGLIHFRQTAISPNPSHFEVPGIHSARLESIAKPHQILCTDTVHAIFAPHYGEMFPSEPLQVETKDRTLVAYDIAPLPLPNIRIVISDLIFADSKRLGKTLCGTKKLLIVDDDPSTMQVLSEILSPYVEEERIVIANDGEDALRLFSPGDFMAVLTDIIMPRMSGIELAHRIATIDPDVPVVIMSGYSEAIRDERVFESGVVLAFEKPFAVDSILRGLFFAAAFGTPSNLRSRLHLITNDPTGFLRRIERIADAISHILNSANNAQDVGQSLLRHKAKQVADEVIRRLVPGGDVVQYLESAVTQLRKLRLLCTVVNPHKDLSMEEHFQNMAEDYAKANKKANLTLECDMSAAPVLSPIRSVAFLVAAEFIDNALDAVKHKGIISIDVYWERALQQLRIEVTDNGPGVPHDMVSDLFRFGYTTKGEGRGLGLSLVNQACRAFHGTTHYSHEEDTTVLVATFRLPDHPHPRKGKPEQINSADAKNRAAD